MIGTSKIFTAKPFAAPAGNSNRVILTISNEYGCGAYAISRLAASELGYEFVDEQLPVVVAKRLRTSPEAVESAEDLNQTVGERMLRVLELGTPEVDSTKDPNFDEQCLREVQLAVREYADHGNVLLFGRGAGAILGRRAGLLRIFMHAPKPWRIAHVMDGSGVDEKTALEEIERIDRARRDYLKTYYGQNWGDPAHYDLSLDTSIFGRDGSAAIIVRAASVVP